MLAAAQHARLYSYVVRYDSGFAPNPFYGICTLATCKPDIRKAARIGDWVVGTGSADKRIERGGFLVYAMRVTEILTIREYWNDSRFRRKRPNLRGSWKLASGDNIYRWNAAKKGWDQLDSYHSRPNGSLNPDHRRKDTSVDRILISTDFVYFGGRGPQLPRRFRNQRGAGICKQGRGRKIIDDMELIQDFVAWLRSLDHAGYAGPPLDWVSS
jgi:Nucleotide modification associated domain 2